MYTAGGPISMKRLWTSRIPAQRCASGHQHVKHLLPRQRIDARRCLQPKRASFGLPRFNLDEGKKCDKAGGSFYAATVWLDGSTSIRFEQTSAKIWSLERQMQEAMEVSRCRANNNPKCREQQGYKSTGGLGPSA